MSTPVKLTFRYPTGKTKTIETSIPDGWSGVLKPEKALRALSEHPGAHGQVLALKHVLKLKPGDYFALSNEQVADLLSLTPWLKLAPHPTPVMGNFNWRRKRICWPKAKGANMSFREWVIGDAAFDKYLAGDNTALQLLAGVVLRERKTKRSFHFARVADIEAINLSGDDRVVLKSRSEAEARANSYTSKPLRVEAYAALLMYWAGLREYISKAYGAYLFEDPNATADDVGPKLPNFGWHGKALEIAATGVMGTVDDVYDANAHVVFMYLVKSIAEARAERDRQRLQKAKS